MTSLQSLEVVELYFLEFSSYLIWYIFLYFALCLRFIKFSRWKFSKQSEFYQAFPPVFVIVISTTDFWFLLKNCQSEIATFCVVTMFGSRQQHCQSPSSEFVMFFLWSDLTCRRTIQMIPHHMAERVLVNSACSSKSDSERAERLDSGCWSEAPNLFSCEEIQYFTICKIVAWGSFWIK